MTAASCPSCGAQITFQLGSSMVVVCASCRSVVARTDRDVESLGKVAALAETDSALHVGLQGRYKGRIFRLTGRAQMRHAAGGVWDEWYAAFDDGRWGWLAEARGVYTMAFKIETPAALPPYGQLQLGAQIASLGGGRFVVAELGEATTIAAEGEIPWRLTPNETYSYADLSGSDRRFATLDYSEAEPLLFAGQEIDLAALGIAFDDNRQRERAVPAASLPCPKCGGPLELKAPDKAERVACPYCGSLLDVEQGNLKFLRAMKQISTPTIPLGAKGKIQGFEFVVIGYVVRSVTFDRKYFWEEYLLYNRDAGFRWLVQSDDHWSFVGPVAVGDVDDPAGDEPSRRIGFRGKQFRIFQDAPAKVEYVIGEFYWKVEVGETVRCIDYVAPPEMISKEISSAGTTSEVNYSHGVYVTPGQIEDTFGVKSLRRPEGVAPNQPSPQRGMLKAWAMAFGALVVLAVVLAIFAPRKTLVSQTFDLGVAAGQSSKNFDSAPFHLDGGRNIEIRVESPVSNSWIYVDGVLFNTKTGQRQEFGIPVEYYFGRDSDGSWTEGSTSSTTYLGALPEGDYTLNMEVQWQPGTNPGLKMSVRQGVPHMLHFLLAAVALSVLPLIAGFRKLNFEQRRWAESDFSAAG